MRTKLEQSPITPPIHVTETIEKLARDLYPSINKQINNFDIVKADVNRTANSTNLRDSSAKAGLTSKKQNGIIQRGVAKVYL